MTPPKSARRKPEPELDTELDTTLDGADDPTPAELRALEEAGLGAMPTHGRRTVSAERLRSARAPAAELAAAAHAAQESAGIAVADFVVIAVEAGGSAELELALEAADL